MKSILGVRNLTPLLSSAVDRLRLHPRQFVPLIILGLIANYFGFIWAMTDFNPFYSDWRFFINLSLGFLFACGFALLIVQIISSLLSFLSMILTLFIPNQVMKLQQIIGFRVPMLGYRVLGTTLLSTFFIFILFYIYTDIAILWILLAIMVVPLTVAIWGFIVYWEIRHHRIEVTDLKTDLGQEFVLTADTIDHALEFVENAEHQLEEFILSHLPENLRKSAEHLLKQAHHLAQALADQIPDKEDVGLEIQKLQLRIADIRWDIAYARYALPRLRSIMIGLTLAYSILLGAGHFGRYVSNNQGELSLVSGEVILATPIAHRGPWEVFYTNDQILLINENELQAFNPKPSIK